MFHRLGVTLPVVLAWATASASLGAELLCTASSWETYVGTPVQIQVIIKNALVYEPPAFPDIAEAEVRELRQEGQAYPTVTRPVVGVGHTVVYTYAVTPRQAGTLTVPPIRVTADGERFSTSSIQILVKESKAGDLLFLELFGTRESVYVGEPSEATLEIWLKPYSIGNVRMDAEDMWRYAIDEQASAWGPFTENLRGRPRKITCRTEMRPDAKGDLQRYFVYSLSREVWPERPGPFGTDGVRVVVNYPLKMRRKPSTLLGRPYEVVESRPISAEVEDSKIVVKAPPPEGRPDTFRGAVGKYTMTVTAAPNEVSVGDPIALTLTIRGTGRMDLLQAPQMVHQESLTADFRVPEEELAGTVSGAVKVFSQTVRAKHDSVTSVPPIRFSYFDPEVDRYFTLESDPIPLDVRESTRLMASPTVAGGSDGAGRTELTPVENGLLASYDNVQAMLAQQSVSVGWGTWCVGLSGPALWLVCLLGCRHRDRVADDVGLERRRRARKAALRVIRRALAEADVSAAAAQAAVAVTRYVADRCNLPPGKATRSDVIHQLRLRHVPEATVDKVDGLLAECEGAQYGVVERAGVKGLIERAHACVQELEGRRLGDA